MYAGVHLLDLPYGVDREFDYSVPDSISGEICPGRFVSVPFGKGDRGKIALVTSLKSEPSSVLKDDSEKSEDADSTDNTLKTGLYASRPVIKEITALCPDSFSLDAELLKVVSYLCSQTLCTVGEAVHSMIPASAFSKLNGYYEAVPGVVPPNDPKCSPVYELIVSRGRVPASSLLSKFGKDVQKTLDRLKKHGCISLSLELSESGRQTENTYSPAVDLSELSEIKDGKPVICGGRKCKITSEGQIAVIEAFIESQRPMLEKELRSIPGVTLPNLHSLVQKGLISKRTYNVDRDLLLMESRSYATGSQGRTPIELSPEQTRAYEELRGLAFSGLPKAALLEGVTGSGKTCVMMRLIDDVLDAGRGVILLLPEISLTPQSLSIFCSRYGERVAVMHSGLSAGERSDAYLRIKTGQADLVVGTRSAVFAPVVNLGLIIIDEEQEHTYKSDSDPRYHARDIARVRCASQSALMLLASATPSLESRKKAEDGKYSFIRLTQRYGSSVLPTVTVADMRLESVTGNVTPIGSLLRRKLRETYERGEQSVLFLNRRGYNNYFSCSACGEALKCPNCSVSLTFHTDRGSYSRGRLVCHWCGLSMNPPEKCPSCGEGPMLRMGYGTQRVEEELSKLLPGARIMRMDTDSTTTKDAYDTMLGAFRRHEADVLLGTQMVTKGHDFPDVTLVGVLLADASLYYDDYRASERTFAMLTQVIGRAGRRDKPGEAVIQTNNPTHEIIALAGKQDYETMYRREIRLRKAMLFPPFCDIVLLTVTSVNERESVSASRDLHNMITAARELKEEYKALPIVMFGPFEAPVYRVDGKYRMRIILKSRSDRNLREMLAGILADFKSKYPSKRDGADVILSVDFNPTTL